MRTDFGYADYIRAQQIEERAKEAGFKLTYSKYSDDYYGDNVALVPLDKALPAYARDAEIFRGTFREVDCWLKGVEWLKSYYEIIKATDSKKVVKREDNIRHQLLVDALKGKNIYDEPIEDK